MADNKFGFGLPKSPSSVEIDANGNEKFVFDFGKKYVVLQYEIDKLKSESVGRVELGTEELSGSILLSISFYTASGELISTETAEIPMSSSISTATLDYENKKIILTNTDGGTVECDISSLVVDTEGFISNEADDKVNSVEVYRDGNIQIGSDSVLSLYGDSVTVNATGNASISADEDVSVNASGTLHLNGSEVYINFEVPETQNNKGAANGYAPLGADAKVPSSYMPSSYDDVVMNDATWGDKSKNVEIRREDSIFLTTADYDNNTGAEFFVQTQNTTGKEGFAQVYVLDGDSGVGASISLDGGDSSINLQANGYIGINVPEVFVNATGNANINADADVNVNATGNASVNASADVNVNASGTLHLNGSEVYINGTNTYINGTEVSSYAEEYYVNADTRIDLVAPQVNVTGTLNVVGDIVQDGSTYETHAEQIYTEKDHIILRDKAVSGLSAGTYAGLITKLADGTNDAFFGYNGDGIARVGDITYVGGVPDFSDTQALATRQDAPIANGVAYWNNTDKRFDTHSNMTYRTADNSLRANLFSSPQGIIADGGSINAYINTSNNGTIISRNIADSNPALKVNLANAGATGNIAEFQWQGANKVYISKDGILDVSGYVRSAQGITNSNGASYSHINTATVGTTISRNVNDANPALTVNKQQGTGDVLRLQYGGATKSVFNKDGWLGIGVISPNNPITISGTGQQVSITRTDGGNMARFANSGFNASLSIGSHAVNIALIQAGSASKLGLATNNSTTPSVLIDTNSNVGIGTTTPSAKLHVAGDLKVDGDLIQTKSAVDYTEIYSNTISSTFGDIVPYKDGTPLVTEISGRTMPVVTQLVTNSDFSDGTNEWQNISSDSTVSDGIISNTATGVNSYGIIRQPKNFEIGKYYAKIKFRVTNSLSTELRLRLAGGLIQLSQLEPVINQWYTISNVGNIGAAVNSYVQIQHIYNNTTDATGAVMEVDYVILFNLTYLISNKTYSPLYNKTFDLMSDAEIKAQMDEWVQTNKIPTSVVQHLENTTLKSTGKNLLPSYTGVLTDWNSNIFTDASYYYKTLKVKPNTSYTFQLNTFGTVSSGTYMSMYGNSIAYTTIITLGSHSCTTTSTSNGLIHIGLDRLLWNNSEQNNINNLQLEEGSTATAYTPYKSETQSFVHGRLSRLPNNVSDKIRYDNGKYVLDRYVQEYKISPTPTTPTISSKDMYRVQVTLPAIPIDWSASSTHPILFSSVQGNIKRYSDWSSAPTSSYGWAAYSNGGKNYIDVVIPIGSTFATVMGEITIYYQLATPLLATQTIDVDGTLVQDSVTTIEQTQALATEYDVKFAINAEQTVVNLVDRDKIQQEVIDSNEQKLEPITNTSGNLALTGTTTLTSTVTTNLTVNTGGTLLASGDGDTIVTVSALSNYKYIELRGNIGGVDLSSTKIPTSELAYNSENPIGSVGISLTVSGYNGITFTGAKTLIAKPYNAGFTSIRVIAEPGEYDIYWEVYGWNY